MNTLRHDLAWPVDAALVFTVTPTVDGVVTVDGATLWLSTTGQEPLADRTNASQYLAVADGTVTVTLPASLQIHRWWRLDVAPAGNVTPVGFGRLNPVMA
jgi:hypothetical protein